MTNFHLVYFTEYFTFTESLLNLLVYVHLNAITLFLNIIIKAFSLLQKLFCKILIMVYEIDELLSIQTELFYNIHYYK